MKTKLFPVLRASGLLLAAAYEGSSECLTGDITPLACWKGEGDASSQCGFFPAVWVNTAAYVSGKVGSAFSFDGSSYLRVTDADALSFDAPGAALTIEAWVNPTTWSGGVVAKGSGSAVEYSLSLNRTTNSVVFTMALKDPTNPLSPPQLFTAAGGVGMSNQWHHLAGVYRVGAAVAVFLDGMRVGTTPLSPTRAAQNTTSPLYLGRAGAPGQNLAGGLDEVYLYPVALNDQDIQSICATGSLGHCVPSNCVAPPAGLVA